MNRRQYKKNLVLVQPQQFGLLEGFACGLISLANYVDKHLPEVDVRLLDLSHIPTVGLVEEIQAVLPQDGDLFVGITTTTAGYQSALYIARLFRQIAPHCVIIFGGHHASPQDTLILNRHRDVVDIIVRGEGEIPLTHLLRQYPRLGFVPGISYVDKQGNIQRNIEAPLLNTEALDEIALTFRGEGMRSTPGKFDHVTYVSARGCPLKCAFCAVANQAIRAKSVPKVIEDLRYLVEEMDFKSIAIEDNFFAHSPRRTRELCQAIADYRNQSGKLFTWDCQTRVESLRSKEILEAMEEAGCEAVYIGVESLVEEHLRYLQKTPSPEHYLSILTNQVIPELMKTKIGCYINLQLGLPGETEEHRSLTLDRLARLGGIAASANRTITIFPMLHVVYPGTRHFQDAVAAGRLAEDCFETFTQWEAREEPILNWLGEHFAHGTGGIPTGILDADKLSRNEFSVQANAVLGVIHYMTRMSKTTGIQVFSYGRYLVPNAN